MLCPIINYFSSPQIKLCFIVTELQQGVFFIRKKWNKPCFKISQLQNIYLLKDLCIYTGEIKIEAPQEAIVIVYEDIFKSSLTSNNAILTAFTESLSDLIAQMSPVSFK